MCPVFRRRTPFVAGAAGGGRDGRALFLQRLLYGEHRRLDVRIGDLDVRRGLPGRVLRLGHDQTHGLAVKLHLVGDEQLSKHGNTVTTGTRADGETTLKFSRYNR